MRYFMEVDYAKALEEHLGPAKDYPRLHRLIEEHLWATTSHAYEVGLCLERLNWNVKDLILIARPCMLPLSNLRQLIKRLS